MDARGDPAMDATCSRQVRSLLELDVSWDNLMVELIDNREKSRKTVWSPVELSFEEGN